jgi:hypothetical protein
MITLHPAFQGLIAVTLFVTVALALWISFARSGSRPKSSGNADDPVDHA